MARWPTVLYAVAAIFVLFQGYETAVSFFKPAAMLRVVQRDSIAFPALTVCAANPDVKLELQLAAGSHCVAGDVIDDAEDGTFASVHGQLADLKSFPVCFCAARTFRSPNGAQCWRLNDDPEMHPVLQAASSRSTLVASFLMPALPHLARGLGVLVYVHSAGDEPLLTAPPTAIGDAAKTTLVMLRKHETTSDFSFRVRETYMPAVSSMFDDSLTDASRVVPVQVLLQYASLTVTEEVLVSAFPWTRFVASVCGIIAFLHIVTAPGSLALRTVHTACVPASGGWGWGASSSNSARGFGLRAAKPAASAPHPQDALLPPPRAASTPVRALTSMSQRSTPPAPIQVATRSPRAPAIDTRTPSPYRDSTAGPATPRRSTHTPLLSRTTSPRKPPERSLSRDRKSLDQSRDRDRDHVSDSESPKHHHPNPHPRSNSRSPSRPHRSHHHRHRHQLGSRVQ
eukprot:gnl/Spiro4/4606_TR2301_c1_g1_i2.p1 gnl/Spiro4/4606_TR2301_c1_g1~~gnl/Spiro4/4606_TR2301_c1_g1_i2.p1  ORF type:complete len:467 (+),score=97.18 gnl/Spiro4/4606_TR2301_c1_g1_i2:38-1402(+)